jgi:hypothetical protein
MPTDVVLVPDNVTRILAYGWKGSVSDYAWLANQWIVVQVLAPMIKAGVVRFWSGALPICLKCADEFYKFSLPLAFFLVRHDSPP